MFTSTDGHTGAWLKNCTHLCPRMKKNPSSGHPCRHPVGLCRTCSLTAHHNTKHHLDSTIFSKNTLHILHNSFNHDLLREPQAHLAQLQTITRSERIAKSLSVTTKSRVAEPCEQNAPHFSPVIDVVSLLVEVVHAQFYQSTSRPKWWSSLITVLTVVMRNDFVLCCWLKPV